MVGLITGCLVDAGNPPKIAEHAIFKAGDAETTATVLLENWFFTHKYLVEDAVCLVHISLRASNVLVGLMSLKSPLWMKVSSSDKNAPKSLGQATVWPTKPRYQQSLQTSRV